jgi:protoporphyrinogen oxidase
VIPEPLSTRQMKMTANRLVIIAGAGPAGLTAAYELVRRGARPVVIEKDDMVGGISRTNEFRGFRFDLGGHRFFTRSARVNRIWEEVLRDRFMRVRRLSRIYYDHRFFEYPLRIGNVLRQLGLWESLLIVLSFIRSQLASAPREETLEEWICNRFGRRLYRMFFKSYTEKVWGMPCNRIPAEWAAQRIKGLSFRTAVLAAIAGNRRNRIKSLIEEFRYPELGPGMMWETMRDHVLRSGGTVMPRSEVVRIRLSGNRVTSFTVLGPDGERNVEGEDFIASMAITDAIARMDPPPPAEVLSAAAGLRHRAFLTVGLIVDRPGLFPDNWIYVHSPEVRMGRLQNFGNWSRHMIADPSRSCLGAEYFVDEGDEMWRASDEELVKLASGELRSIGLLGDARVEAGVVYRVSKAYPVYDQGYLDRLGRIRGFLDGLENFQMVGRNGLHRYNNQDHSMLTAILAVENIFGASHDIWSVNSDTSYHEEVTEER